MDEGERQDKASAPLDLAQIPVLAQIAQATRLREGVAGVIAVLRAVKRNGPAPLNEIAREVRLPLPVASAVRRELEKADLVKRDGGLALTDRGRRLVEERLGIRAVDTVEPVTAPDADEPEQNLVAELKDCLTSAPPVDVTFDQAPCTAETAIRRAKLMHRQGAIEGRRILILGDDDSVSLAIWLYCRQHLNAQMRYPITVLELEPKRAAFLQQSVKALDAPIEVISHDLRDPLSSDLLAAFDVIETDPPYTIAGVGLFLERVRQALTDAPGTLGFLSYAQRSGADQYDLCRTILNSGFAITAMHPGFNAYEGASILGSQGQMIELTGVETIDRPGHRNDGKLYTADFSTRPRIYKCTQCGKVYRLGRGDVPGTIEALKAAGCATCGGQTFRRLSGARPSA